MPFCTSYNQIIGCESNSPMFNAQKSVINVQRQFQIRAKDNFIQTLKAGNIKKIHTFKKSRKAAACYPFRCRGSLTVEGAVVVPVLIFAWLAIICLISTLRVREAVAQSLHQSVLEMAVAAGDDTGSVKLGGTFSTWLSLKTMDHLEEAGVKNVSDFNMIGSDIMADDQWINLKVSYRIEVLQGLIPLPKILATQRAVARAWTGYAPGEDDPYGTDPKDYVYVTSYGSVYHEDRMCTHIYLSVHMADEAEAMRYPPCEYCGHDACEGATYYIAKNGECYHTRYGCSGLKRTVRRTDSSDVQAAGLTPCSRCCGN